MESYKYSPMLMIVISLSIGLVIGALIERYKAKTSLPEQKPARELVFEDDGRVTWEYADKSRD